MKFGLFLFFLVFSVVARGQDDDTIRFVQGLAEAGTDSSLYDDVNAGNPPTHYRKADMADLPSGLKKELEGNTLFSGWKDRTIWYDGKTGLYWISLVTQGSIRTYGLTRDGATVSIKETEVPDEINNSP